MDQSPQGELSYHNFDEGELTIGLRPYVMPPDRLHAAVANGAPVVLPGLVMATVVCMGHHVNYLPTSSILELGRAEVLATAIENVRNLDGVQVIRELDIAGRDDTEVVTLWANDPFIASRVTVLDWLVEQLYASPAPDGVLVAVPCTARLMLHVPAGIGVLKVVQTMALAARHWFDTAEEQWQISPDVYFASHNEGAQRVTIPDKTQIMIDMMSRPFAHRTGRARAGCRRAGWVGRLSVSAARRLPAAEAERPHPVVEDGGAFGRPVTDAVVLHQHDPTLLPGMGQPRSISNGLVGWDSIDLSQSPQSQSHLAQQCRHLPAAEATVKKQLGQTFGVHHRHELRTGLSAFEVISGGDAGGDTDCIL